MAENPSQGWEEITIDTRDEVLDPTIVRSTSNDVDSQSSLASRAPPLTPDRASVAFHQGSLVWARSSAAFPFWPACIVSHDHLPDELRQSLFLSPFEDTGEGVHSEVLKRKIPVFYFGRRDFDLVKPTELRSFLTDLSLREQEEVSSDLRTAFDLAIEQCEEQKERSVTERLLFVQLQLQPPNFNQTHLGSIIEETESEAWTPLAQGETQREEIEIEIEREREREEEVTETETETGRETVDVSSPLPSNFPSIEGQTGGHNELEPEVVESENRETEKSTGVLEDVFAAPPPSAVDDVFSSAPPADTSSFVHSEVEGEVERERERETIRETETQSETADLFSAPPPSSSQSSAVDLFGAPPSSSTQGSAVDLFGAPPRPTALTPPPPPPRATSLSAADDLFGAPPSNTTLDPFSAPPRATTSTPPPPRSPLSAPAPPRTTAVDLFASPPVTTTSDLFAAPPSKTSSDLFSAPPRPQGSASDPFGAPPQSTSSDLFGAPPLSSTADPFSAPPRTTVTPPPPLPSVVSAPPRTTAVDSVFGAPPPSTSSDPFAAPPRPHGSAPDPFSAPPRSTTSPPPPPSVTAPPRTPANTTSVVDSLFGAPPRSTSSVTAATTTASHLFGGTPEVEACVVTEERETPRETETLPREKSSAQGGAPGSAPSSGGGSAGSGGGSATGGAVKVRVRPVSLSDASVSFFSSSVEQQRERESDSLFGPPSTSTSTSTAASLFTSPPPPTSTSTSRLRTINSNITTANNNNSNNAAALFNSNNPPTSRSVNSNSSGGLSASDVFSSTPLSTPLSPPLSVHKTSTSHPSAVDVFSHAPPQTHNTAQSLGMPPPAPGVRLPQMHPNSQSLGTVSETSAINSNNTTNTTQTTQTQSVTNNNNPPSVANVKRPGAPHHHLSSVSAGQPGGVDLIPTPHGFVRRTPATQTNPGTATQTNTQTPQTLAVPQTQTTQTAPQSLPESGARPGRPTRLYKPGGSVVALGLGGRVVLSLPPVSLSPVTTSVNNRFDSPLYRLPLLAQTPRPLQIYKLHLLGGETEQREVVVEGEGEREKRLFFSLLSSPLCRLLSQSDRSKVSEVDEAVSVFLKERERDPVSSSLSPLSCLSSVNREERLLVSLLSLLLSLSTHPPLSSLSVEEREKERRRRASEVVLRFAEEVHPGGVTSAVVRHLLGGAVAEAVRCALTEGDRELALLLLLAMDDRDRDREILIKEVMSLSLQQTQRPASVSLSLSSTERAIVHTFVLSHTTSEVERDRDRETQQTETNTETIKTKEKPSSFSLFFGDDPRLPQRETNNKRQQTEREKEKEKPAAFALSPHHTSSLSASSSLSLSMSNNNSSSYSIAERDRERQSAIDELLSDWAFHFLVVLNTRPADLPRLCDRLCLSLLSTETERGRLGAQIVSLCLSLFVNRDREPLSTTRHLLGGGDKSLWLFSLCPLSLMAQSLSNFSLSVSIATLMYAEVYYYLRLRYAENNRGNNNSNNTGDATATNNNTTNNNNNTSTSNSNKSKSLFPSLFSLSSSSTSSTPSITQVTQVSQTLDQYERERLSSSVSSEVEKEALLSLKSFLSPLQLRRALILGDLGLVQEAQGSVQQVERETRQRQERGISVPGAFRSALEEYRERLNGHLNLAPVSSTSSSSLTTDTTSLTTAEREKKDRGSWGFSLSVESLSHFVDGGVTERDREKSAPLPPPPPSASASTSVAAGGNTPSGVPPLPPVSSSFPPSFPPSSFPPVPPSSSTPVPPVPPSAYPPSSSSSSHPPLPSHPSSHSLPPTPYGVSSSLPPHSTQSRPDSGFFPEQPDPTSGYSGSSGYPPMPSYPGSGNSAPRPQIWTPQSAQNPQTQTVSQTPSGTQSPQITQFPSSSATQSTQNTQSAPPSSTQNTQTSSAQPAQKTQKVGTSSGEESLSAPTTGVLGSLRRGILKFILPNAVDATENTGQSLDAYYDQNLGRWVFKGEEDSANNNPALGPPPPPRNTSFSLSDPNPQSGSTQSSQSQEDSLSRLMAPPPVRSLYNNNSTPSGGDGGSGNGEDPLSLMMKPPPLRGLHPAGGASTSSLSSLSSPSLSGAPPTMGSGVGSGQGTPKVVIWKPPTAQNTQSLGQQGGGESGAGGAGIGFERENS